MLTITLYTQPACVQCTATYRKLDARGVLYEVVDVSQDADALALVKSLGHLRAPVVVVREGDEIVEHWSGFDPDRCDALPVPERVA